MKPYRTFLTSVDWDTVRDFLNSQFSVINEKTQSWLKTNLEWNGNCNRPGLACAAITFCFYLKPDARLRRGAKRGAEGLRVWINGNEVDTVAVFVASLTAIHENLEVKRVVWESLPTELRYEIRVKDYSPFKKK